MRLRKLIVTLVGLMVACGRGPGGPTPVAPAPAAAPTVVSLTVTGPATIPPGQSVQFKAAAALGNGSSEDYTSQARWTSGNANIVTVSPTGLATGLSRGETDLSAFAGAVRVFAHVTVIPGGEFRVTGLVTEIGLPVVGATVTVIAGVETGQSSKTDLNGRYALYGAAGSVQIQVTKDGYAPVAQALSVSANSVQDFTIAQTNIRNVAGAYAMTLAADPACPAEGTAQFALPNDLRTRHYLAAVTQNGVSLHVALSGAPFLTSGGFGSGFDARLEPSGMSLVLNDGYYSPHADLVELLGPNSVLLIEGSATLVQSGPDFSGALEGLFITGSTAVWANNWSTASCYSQSHRVVLTRQTTASLQRIHR